MKSLKWTFALFAISVLLSQALMDFMSVVFVLVFFAIYIGKKEGLTLRQIYPRLGVEPIFLIWFLTVLISFAVNYQQDPPWLRRIPDFLWIPLLYPMVGFLRLSFPTQKVLKFAVFVVLAVDVFAIVSWWVHKTWVIEPFHDRAGGTFSDPMTYAHSTALLFMLLAGLVMVKDAIPRQWAWPMRLIFLLTGICILLTFTRGVWLGVFLATTLIVTLYRPFWGVAVVIGGLGFVGTLSQLWPQFHERLYRIYASDSYDHQRLTLWKTNLLIWRENPIFGIGYDENSRRLREFYDRLGIPAGYFQSHAHNQFLHFAAGTGTVGLLCYLSCFGFFIAWNWSLIPRLSHPWHVGILWGTLGAQICFLFDGLTEVNFGRAKVRLALMFIWSLVGALGGLKMAEVNAETSGTH